MAAIIKNRRSGREGQANGKCKCRWGFNEQGVWGKVFKTCGKPVDFHIDEKTGRKIGRLTCLACRTQQAKHFGTTVKVAKVAKPKVAKPKVAKVAKRKVAKVTKSRAGAGHYLVATPKVAQKVQPAGPTVEDLTTKVDQLQKLVAFLVNNKAA